MSFDEFQSRNESIANEGGSGLVKGMAKSPEIAEEDINVMLATNVTGLINLTQAILPIFLGRPDGGKGDIINVGSIAGRSSHHSISAFTN